MARRLGPAHPRGMTWNGAGAWLIRSQSRQVNFSRTISTTFQQRGIDSSVRVTSSPSLRSLTLPQHSHALGGSTTTRSLGRCSGKVVRVSGRRRTKPETRVVLDAASSAASSSALALASCSSSSSSIWSISWAWRSERWP